MDAGMANERYTEAKLATDIPVFWERLVRSFKYQQQFFEAANAHGNIETFGNLASEAQCRITLSTLDIFKPAMVYRTIFCGTRQNGPRGLRIMDERGKASLLPFQIAGDELRVVMRVGSLAISADQASEEIVADMLRSLGVQV
jgi:hypothetical protein